MSTITRDVAKHDYEYFEFDSPERFLATDCRKTGLYSIRHAENVYTDVLYWNQKSNVTIVCFNGAGFPSDNVRPGFNGTSMFRSWRNENKANFLFIHDATLYLDSGLSLAWYGGSQDFPYQDQLEILIRKFVEVDPPHHLVFFGVSGGGHTALNYSARFPGSIAVAGNPQTNVDNYLDWAKNKYYQTCWSKPDEPGVIDNSGFLHDMVSVYARAPQNFAYCLVNVNDRHHVKDHLVPLIEAAHNTLNIRTLLRHWGKGHTACPPEFFLEFFKELIDRRRAGEVFPNVCGARLLESRDDVDAMVNHQVSPLEVTLFRGELDTAAPLFFDLPSFVNGTVELTLEVQSESDEAVSISVEFVLDHPGDGRYVYGLRPSTLGYQATMSLRPGNPSMLRTYLPTDFRATAIRFIPSPKETIRLTGAGLVAYSHEHKEKKDQ